jgi:hypothetical protein
VDLLAPSDPSLATLTPHTVRRTHPVPCPWSRAVLVDFTPQDAKCTRHIVHLPALDVRWTSDCARLDLVLGCERPGQDELEGWVRDFARLAAPLARRLAQREVVVVGLERVFAPAVLGILVGARWEDGGGAAEDGEVGECQDAADDSNSDSDSDWEDEGVLLPEIRACAEGMGLRLSPSIWGRLRFLSTAEWLKDAEDPALWLRPPEYEVDDM